MRDLSWMEQGTVYVPRKEVPFNPDYHLESREEVNAETTRTWYAAVLALQATQPDAPQSLPLKLFDPQTQCPLPSEARARAV